MITNHLKSTLLGLLLFTAVSAPAAPADTNASPAWLSRPLALKDAIDLALQQNGTILRGKSDLEAQYGVVVQIRAVAIPKVQANGAYQYTKEVEGFPIPGGPPAQNQTWDANIQLVQTIYQGGQINSALRSARLTKEQAVLQYQTIVADSLLLVRIAYYDILQAAEQILVEEASVKLLTQELDDQKRRYDAGTVPRFNVLRAEGELANERPRLIQARNAHRISKNNLVNFLGYHMPPHISEDVPMQLTDKLDDQPYQIELAVAVAKALESRSELAALRKQEALKREALITAKSNYKPTVQAVGGYGARNTIFNNDLGTTVRGWNVGAQASWSIFDGGLTRGKTRLLRSRFPVGF